MSEVVEEDLVLQCAKVGIYVTDVNSLLNAQIYCSRK